jgi:hypothetical protein
VANVIEEHNRKKMTGGGHVARNGRTRNVNRILAEKLKEKKQSGRQMQMKESGEKKRQRVFYIVRQSVAKII